jgi:hypothetical protein
MLYRIISNEWGGAEPAVVAEEMRSFVARVQHPHPPQHLGESSRSGKRARNFVGLIRPPGSGCTLDWGAPEEGGRDAGVTALVEDEIPSGGFDADVGRAVHVADEGGARFLAECPARHVGRHCVCEAEGEDVGRVGALILLPSLLLPSSLSLNVPGYDKDSRVKIL